MTDFKETDIGQIPSHWNLLTVDEIKSPTKKSIISGPFGSNISAKYFVESGVPVIRGNNLSLDIQIKFKDDGFVFITDEKANELGTWAEKDDIIFTAVGTIGQVGILVGKEKYSKYIISNKQLRLRVNTDLVEPLYAYYWFASPFMIDMILQRNTGSSVPLINLSVLKSLLIPLPPKEERISILKIISSLDNKIDLLHRQNATLEKMAETLFRQWFVEEAKENWEEIRLGSLVEVINGVSYKSDDLNPSTTAMVTLKSFDRNGGFRMDGFKEYIGKYKDQHILKEGDLVVAHTDITQEAEVIGNPVMVIGNPKYETLVFSMDLVKVISKSENYTNEFLYLLMKSREFKEHCLGYSNGSTVLHLSKKAIPEYEMKLPPDSLINEFSKKVKPLVQKQFRNQTQIRTLTALRDTLLPKLMSGEITVQL